MTTFAFFLAACTIQTFQLTIKNAAKLGKLELIKKIDIPISISQSSLQTTAKLVQTIWAIMFTIPLSDF